MYEIKLINKNSDLSKINRLEWDVVVNDEEYYVYHCPGFIHSIGGKRGYNDYWCCLRKENPSFETLREFNGESCRWGFFINENHSNKYKWKQRSLEVNIKIEILRNDKNFYTFVVNNFDYGMVKARKLLFEINEHPINFHEINYKNKILNTKIEWKMIPCIITEYYNEKLVIIPDLKFTTKEAFLKAIFYNCDNELSVVDDLFSSSINWFRRDGNY